MRAILIIFFLIMLTACVNYPAAEPRGKESMSKGDTPVVEENLPQVSEPYISGDFKFILQTSKRFYDVGEPVEFFLIVKNIANTSEKYYDGHLPYHVLNETNDEIIRYNLVTLDDQIIPLNPGEIYRARGIWHQRVLPGDYTIELLRGRNLNVTVTIAESRGDS